MIDARAWGGTAAKSLATLKELKKTAYHHYGHHPLSILKFLYYSGMRVNTFHIYEFDLAGEFPDLAPDPGFRIVMPTVEELEKVREGRDLTREFYYDRLLGVKTCCLALRGDEPAYIHWVLFRGDHSRFFRLGEKVAELSYSTTIPKFRGNNLQAKLFAHHCRELRDRGYRKAVAAIHELNTPSLRSIELAGWRKTREVKALGPFHRKIDCTA